MSSQGRYERVRYPRPSRRDNALAQMIQPRAASEATIANSTNMNLQVAAQDDDASPVTPTSSSLRQQSIPNSPPPSFRSRASSPQSRRHSISSHDPLRSEAERTLADTFDAPSDDESDNDHEHGDDRQRLMRGNPSASGNGEADDEDVRPGQIQRRITELPSFVPPSAPGTNGPVYGGGNSGHDGVFANLSAKPTRGEDLDEKPPVRIPFRHQHFSKVSMLSMLSMILRLMNKPPPMPHHHTGKPPFSPPAWPATKSSLTASRLARSSPLSGTASSACPSSSSASCSRTSFTPRMPPKTDLAPVSASRW